MGCLMELYGLDNKVVVTFRNTHGMSNGIIWAKQQGFIDFQEHT